jgi:hypothetical protein
MSYASPYFHLQVIKACRKIREGGLPLKAVNIHDGTSSQDQLEGLENQVVDLVAATPGRLSQLNIVKGDLLSRVTFAVSRNSCCSTPCWASISDLERCRGFKCYRIGVY